MLSRHLPALALALWLGLPTASAALSIQLSPADQTVAPAASVAVELLVRSPGGILVGGYDVVVSFDPAVLGFVGVDFGAGLGGPADSIQVVSPGAADVELVEVSLLLSPPQDGVSDFALFTLRFDALAPGISALEVTPGSDPATDFLSDEFGFAITPTAIVSGRVIVAVPEPAISAGLTLSALVGAVSIRRIRRGQR